LEFAGEVRHVGEEEALSGDGGGCGVFWDAAVILGVHLEFSSCSTLLLPTLIL